MVVKWEVNSDTVMELMCVNDVQMCAPWGTIIKVSVEQTLNQSLNAEADELCGASKYETSPERLDNRGNRYLRKFRTIAGEVILKVARLRNLPY